MNDTSISENYTHQYGMSLSYNEWVESGQTGEVTALLEDGTTVTQTYRNGVLHGQASVTLPYSKKIAKTSSYEVGKVTEETLYLSNGLPAEKKEFSDDGTVRITAWYMTGSPKSIEIYQDTLLNRGEYFSTKNERLATVVEGKGIRIRNNAKGLLLSEDEIEEGIMTLRKTFYSSGEPKSITPYVNNKTDGERKTFLSDGQPKTIEAWSNGSKTGPTCIYSNGMLFSKVGYVNGMKQGLEKRFDEDGNVVEKTSWDKGLRHGPAYRYVGDRTYTDWFLKGKKVSKFTYEETLLNRN